MNARIRTRVKEFVRSAQNKTISLVQIDERKKISKKLLTMKQKSVKLDLSSRDKDSRTKHLENFQKLFKKGLTIK